MKKNRLNPTKSLGSDSEKPLCGLRLAPLWVVLACFLVITNLLGIDLLWNWQWSVKEWISHTDELILAVSKATNLIGEAESARNLALIRGDESLSGVLHRNQIALEDEVLPTIERLTRGVPTQEENGDRFIGAVRLRLHRLHAFPTPVGHDDIATIFSVLEQSEMDRAEGPLRLFSQELIHEQDTLRDARDDEFAQTLWRYITLIVACSSVLSILLFVAIRRVRRELVLREQAEFAARESERLEQSRAIELQTLLDTVPAVVLFSQDRESRVVSGSREAYATLRLPIGANTSKTALLAPPEHFKLLQHGRELAPDELPVQYAARTGQAVRDTELEVVFKDGVVRHLFGSVEPLFDEAGAPRGAIAAFTDITDRKEADLLLKASEARWKLSLETGQLGFFEYDYERGTTRWNDSEFRLIGLEPTTVTPTVEEFFKAVHPDDLGKLKSDWQVALESGRLEVEFRIVKPDGEVRWLIGKGTVILDAAGRKRWFTGVNIDITKAKRTEAELSKAVRERTEALNSLRSFIEAAPLGMAVYDRDSRCRMANEPLAAMSGRSVEALLGLTLEEIVPDLASRSKSFMTMALKGDVPVVSHEFEGPDPANPRETGAWIESWFPIFSGDHKVSAVGVVVDNITERKKAEREVARHRDRLQELVELRTKELSDSLKRLNMTERLAALGTLAAGLGHDLANLVLPIRARLESLSLAPVTPEMRGDLVAIGQALDHLSNLSAGMRLMALDPTRPRAASDATDLSVWWSEAQGVFRGVLPRHVRLEGKITPGLGVALPRHQLIQAIFNLVQNAGEVLDGDPDGWVRVEIIRDPSAADSFILIKVSDNGPGMSEEVKARCFEPYFSTKGRTISTGMGLSLVRGIVDSVKGSISVESTLGEGTTFILRLPRRLPSDRMIPRSAGAVLSAAISISEPRQAALVTMIAQRLELKVESLGDRAVPVSDVWITDGASRGAVEHFLAEKGDHRVVYLGSHSFDPGALEERNEYRGRIVALPARPAPVVLRDTIARVVGVGEEALP